MEEAEKYHVLPIDDRTIERMNPALVGCPDVLGDRQPPTRDEGMQGMLENTFMISGTARARSPRSSMFPFAPTV